MAIQAQLYPNNLGFPLCSAQGFMVDNGCGTGGFTQSCFNSQQKCQQLQQAPQQQQLEQRLRQLYNERQRNQNMFDDTNHVSNSKANNVNGANNHNHPSISIPNFEDLAVQFEKQGQEIDQYIRLQNEKLRIMLQEQRKQQAATLFKKVESVSLFLLRQKDEEISQAAKIKLELEDLLTRLEAENQAWRRVAQENEAMVLSLNNTLEQMKERASYCFNNGLVAEDAESCCDESSRGNRVMGMEEEEEETGENRVGSGGVGGDFEQITRKMVVCKGCNSRNSCCLFLPCRHLCSCKACEAFLEACPVCRTPKKASIETLIF